MWVSINNTISQISNLVDVDVSPLSNWDALIYVSATWDWTATALPWGGDMLKATYDTDLDGVVDTAHDVSATPLITRSSVASQWGLLINIDSATGDIPVTSDNWIEDEKYGIYADITAGTASAEFDTAVTRTWTKTLKASSTNATGKINVQINPPTATIDSLSKYCPRLKPSTKYRLRCFCKTNNVAAASALMAIIQYSTTAVSLWTTTSNTLSWTNDWTLLSIDFTSNVSAEYVRIFWQLNVAGNVSDAWFDINSMTLEEVVEPVANSLTSSSPSLVSLTAVGSTDNIDQSQLSKPNGFVMNVAGQYVWQQFTPTKSKITWITLQRITSTGTPTWDMVFRIATDSWSDTPTTTILAAYTMPSATFTALSVWVDFTINLPCNVTAWTKYWILANTTVSSWVNYPWLYSDATNVYTTGVCKYSADWITYWSTYAWDLYFKTLYYKPTTNFKASQNNSTVTLSADEDGFNDWAIVNLSTGTYTDIKNFGTSYTGYLSIYQYLLSTWLLNWTASNLRFDFANEYFTLKFQAPTGFTFWDIAYWTKTVSWGSWARPQYIDYSYDNVTWVTLSTVNTASTTVETTFTIPWGSKTVYVRYLNGTFNNAYYVYYYNFVAPINTSSLSTLKNYPTNKDVVTTYNKSLNTATTTATYRATAWGFPAIEYSATKYQFLDVDTTATWSVVKFSSDWVTYSTVADGANIALSSTTTPLVWVKTNITANRLYLSSNDYNASGDKDGSNKMTVGYQVLSQGLTYTVDELLSEVNELKAAVYALQNP